LGTSPVTLARSLFGRSNVISEVAKSVMNWPVLAGTSTVLLVRNVRAPAAPRVALMRFS